MNGISTTSYETGVALRTDTHAPSTPPLTPTMVVQSYQLYFTWTRAVITVMYAVPFRHNFTGDGSICHRCCYCLVLPPRS